MKIKVADTGKYADGKTFIFGAKEINFTQHDQLFITTIHARNSVGFQLLADHKAILPQFANQLGLQGSIKLKIDPKTQTLVFISSVFKNCSIVIGYLRDNLIIDEASCLKFEKKITRLKELSADNNTTYSSPVGLHRRTAQSTIHNSTYDNVNDSHSLANPRVIR